LPCVSPSHCLGDAMVASWAHQQFEKVLIVVKSHDLGLLCSGPSITEAFALT
jgi:hypothetical protein